MPAILVAGVLAVGTGLVWWVVGRTDPLHDLPQDRVQMFVSGSCGGSQRHLALLERDPELQRKVVPVPIDTTSQELTDRACDLAHAALGEQGGIYGWLPRAFVCAKLTRQGEAWWATHGLAVLPGFVIDGRAVTWGERRARLESRGIGYDLDAPDKVFAVVEESPRRESAPGS